MNIGDDSTKRPCTAPQNENPVISRGEKSARARLYLQLYKSWK